MKHAQQRKRVLSHTQVQHRQAGHAPLGTWSRCRRAAVPGRHRFLRSARHPAMPRRPSAASAWPCGPGRGEEAAVGHGTHLIMQTTDVRSQAQHGGEQLPNLRHRANLRHHVPRAARALRHSHLLCRTGSYFHSRCVRSLLASFCTSAAGRAPQGKAMHQAGLQPCAAEYGQPNPCCKPGGRALKPNQAAHIQLTALPAPAAPRTSRSSAAVW